MSAPVPPVQTFIDRFPEFAGAVDESPGLLERILVEAAAETSDWAHMSTAAQTTHVLLKAAIRAYHSPFAREALPSIDPAKKTKALESQLYGLQVSSTMGLRVF